MNAQKTWMIVTAMLHVPTPTEVLHACVMMDTRVTEQVAQVRPYIFIEPFKRGDDDKKEQRQYII